VAQNQYRGRLTRAKLNARPINSSPAKVYKKCIESPRKELPFLRGHPKYLLKGKKGAQRFMKNAYKSAAPGLKCEKALRGLQKLY